MHLVHPDDIRLPDGLVPDRNGLVALGGGFGPAIVLDAYGKGIFPWTGEHPIPWYSPDPRMLLFPERLHVSRSLGKTVRNAGLAVYFDRAFLAVMRECALMPRPGQGGTWITRNMLEVYGELHQRGFAHSVEVFRGDVMVGGLYGLSLGRAFFGESMFAHEADASKVALHALCTRLVRWRFHFIDCQQVTKHLLAMGGAPEPRRDFLMRLRAAVAEPTVCGHWSDETLGDVVAG